MKKKALLIVIPLVIVGFIAMSNTFLSGKPFKNWKLSDIENVTVELTPPNTTLSVSKNEISELVRILNRVVIYQPNSREDCDNYYGQLVRILITRTDETREIITLRSPIIQIDGTDYSANQEDCKELSDWANKLASHGDG